MTDDFFDPRNPNQDFHSCEGQQKDFCEPPNLGDALWRLPELWTDPASNQLSCSRLVLWLMGCCVVALTWDAIYLGEIEAVTGMVMAVAGTAAGVYFASTAKDFRWKRWRDKE